MTKHIITLLNFPLIAVTLAAFTAVADLGTTSPRADARPRIAVVDFGFAAGKNNFGYASDPQVFVDALAAQGETFKIPAADLAKKGTLARPNVDLLVVPCGSAWPAEAANALVAYLAAGGSLLTCGGYAFDTPVWFRDGAWHDAPVPAMAAGTDPLALPVAKLSPSAPSAIFSPRITAIGDNGFTVAADKFHLWATGGCQLPKDSLKGRQILSFRTQSTAGAKKATVELLERDGSRWQVHFTVNATWREHRFAPCNFKFFSDGSPKNRGKNGDTINFDNVSALRFGASPGEAVENKPACLSIADIKTGVDEYAAQRKAVHIQINTRTARIRDAIHPTESQINAFDPSFTLSNVARLSTADSMRSALPALSLDGNFTGHAAIAQLGVNGHGYSFNRCAWHPILEATAADGTDRGPAAAFVYHHSEKFKGSAWAIFGVDNADLFPSVDAPLVKTLLPEVVKRLLARVALNETTTGYAAYRVGEKASIRTRVGNFGRVDRPVKVRFTLRDENGRILNEQIVSALAKAGANTPVAVDWPIAADAPDYIPFTAELLADDGVPADSEPGAFVVWNERVIANGPKFALDGSRFSIDGRPGFYMGAQTYWGQTRPTIARSPMSFYRDFRQMRAAGLRLTRLFLPWTCEEDKRISDACVQLTQKFGLVIYHTEQAIDTMVEGVELAKQNAIFHEIAARYRNVPGFMIDIRNEPHMKREPSWDSARQMRLWLDTNRAAAREARPDAIVTVGWSQGWAGGKISKDPAWCSLSMDFTDRHYYGPPERMFRDLKDVDMRALGKPLTMPECGAKCHPTFAKEDPWGMGDDDEHYSYRFRCLLGQAFGLGATSLFVWHWRDPMEGIFPCGLVHATGVERPTAAVFSRIAKVFGKLELAENQPDVAIVLREAPRMQEKGRMQFLERAYAVDEALKYWGANWSKITESAIGKCKVKLVIDPEKLPTDDEAAMRLKVGELLKSAGCSFTRQSGDDENLDTYRVPGKNATAWVFWNPTERELTTTRENQRIAVPAKRLVYLQLTTNGAVQALETL